MRTISHALRVLKSKIWNIQRRRDFRDAWLTFKYKLGILPVDENGHSTYVGQQLYNILHDEIQDEMDREIIEHITKLSKEQNL